MAAAKTQKTSELAETSIPGSVRVIGGFDEDLPLAKIEVFGTKAVLYRVTESDPGLRADGSSDPHNVGDIDEAEFHDKLTHARMFVDPDGTRTYVGFSEMLSRQVKTPEAEVSWVWSPL